jgi:murein L,D-transpeptidase YcbB/YkuD
MGNVKISMNGDFAGTAIRIHDTRGFGPQWPNEDSSGCVRVLNLDTELLPRINYGRSGAIEVVFF